TGHVGVADGHFVHHLPVDQLDRLILAQNARVNHLVILLDGEVVRGPLTVGGNGVHILLGEDDRLAGVKHAGGNHTAEVGFGDRTAGALRPQLGDHSVSLDSYRPCADFTATAMSYTTSA